MGDIDIGDALIHAALAVAVVLICGMVGVQWYGATFAIAFFYGREIRDAERKSRELVNTPWKRIFPWFWHPASIAEFVAPAAVSLVLAGLFEVAW